MADNTPSTNVQEEDSLANSLNPLTSKYLASQTLHLSETESLDQIDLRNICDQIVQELLTLENDAAFDYLQVEMDAIDLSKQADQSDAILAELEHILRNFKGHLGNIKNEMAQLQEKSLNMNVSLNNRRQLQKSLEKMIDSILLDPQLIYDICTKEIDENYIGYIKELNDKLEHIKNNHLERYSTVKELEPELNKLKGRACQRIREFILQRFQHLQKPTTNIPVVQQTEMKMYSVFMEFLKNHFIEVFVEILNNYYEFMGKIIVKQFKIYVQEVLKLQVDVYNKNDILISENIQVLRGNLTARAEGMQVDQRSIFSTMKREFILDNKDDTYIIPFKAAQANQKFLLETIFKSINKLLIDTMNSEYGFVCDFFTMKPDKSKQVFTKIFEETLDYLADSFKGMFAHTNDIYSVLLASQLNAQNQKLYEGKGFVVLDQYFMKISQSIWPQFDRLFETQVNSIRSLPLASYKNVERVFGLKPLLLRFEDYILSLYKIHKKGNENYMLRLRISQLKNLIIDLLRKSSKEIPGEIDSLLYFMTGIDFIFSDFSDNSTAIFEEDLKSVEKELNVNIEKLVELALNENFQSLVDFVKKYGGEEKQKQIRKLSNSGTVGQDNYIHTKNQIDTQKDDDDQTTTTLVKDTNAEFKEHWNKRVDTFREQCFNAFGNNNTFKIVLNSMLNSLLAYYGFFYDYVKQKDPSSLSFLLPIHTVMKDIQNHKKKVA